jgi:hypothetical protein
LPAFAQSNITIYSGITSDNLLLFPLFPELAYHNGINIGVSSNFKIIKLLNLSPSFEYTSYQFKNLEPGILLDQFGNNYGSSGEDNLKNYRLSLDIKIIESKPRPFRFFIYTGISYLIEDYPDIKTILNNENGTSTTEVIKLGKLYHFVHDIGLGFIIDINKSIGLSFGTQYYSNYKDTFRYSLNGGIVYNFTN